MTAHDAIRAKCSLRGDEDQTRNIPIKYSREREAIPPCPSAVVLFADHPCHTGDVVESLDTTWYTYYWQDGFSNLDALASNC